MNTSPDLYRDGQMHPTPRFSEEFSSCNIADIDWYMRMPVDPCPVNPTAEMLCELLCGRCLSRTNLPYHRLLASTLRWVGMYARIRVIPCLSAMFKLQQASLERECDIVPP